MPPKFHRRGGKWVRRGGLWLTGDCDCPCGGGACSVCPDLTIEQEFLATVTGVGGGGGRCDAHNASVVLTFAGACTWSKNPAYPPPEDSEGCEFSLWNPLSAIVLEFMAEGVLQVRITDSIGASAGQFVEFNSSFSGPCSALNVTLSGPEIDEFGSLCGICDELCPPESCGFGGGGCYGWCDWSGATIQIEAL